ncbi:uncharacterized protein LOC143143792 isoform X1 [Ptiloglossa arizonensis]|uniref:uncharacterized protein LOC143143792 isoform X1 n=1 Tax=Ptiloglossa arizonensis TaxID=3350558 RepID=UPI003FA193B6
MPNTMDLFDEDVSLLYTDKHGGKFHRFSETRYDTPIINGVVNQLRRWPRDLFFAFLAACLIIGSLVSLIFITVAVCLPTVVDSRCRTEEISITEIEASLNVYFFKLENRKWSTREFCYIETAARKHPDLKVFMINLLKEEPLKRDSNESIGNKTTLKSKPNDYFTSSHPLELTPEEQLRERLALENTNIKNVDISIDKFFKGSKLFHVARHLKDEVLEMAAKAQLLWTTPGIALKPRMFCALDSMKQFLCNRKKDECLPDKLATIEPGNDVQLTGVPCQAFMGFLVQEISRGDINRKYTLMEAVQKFCPRLYYCPEIRILDSKTDCPTESLNCPTIYSSDITQDTKSRNFVT